MFDKLLKSKDILSPSVSRLLQNAGLPVGNVTLTFLVNQRQDIYSIVLLSRGG